MKFLSSIIIAGSIRYLLMISKYSQSIQNRIEVSTPINSWKRVQEGAYLYANGINPYQGDMYHKNPLVLFGTNYLITNFADFVPYFFVLIDILTGILLCYAAKTFIREMFAKEQSQLKKYASNTDQFLIKLSDINNDSFYVALAYLFNPFSILSCVGQTTTVWSNFLLALFFFGLSRRSALLTCITLALETQINIYPFVLIAPTVLHLTQKSTHKILDISLICVLFLLSFLGVNYAGFVIMGDWSFLDSTYGFIIYYRDLQPNIGLFWYFFTEMFDHFRELFLYTFQINATILYLIPLTMKLKDEPIMLATLLISNSAIFRSYPCVGDVAFYLALIPLWKSASKFMAHNFVVGAAMIVTSILAPTVWHLWIYSNSANANFYFGVTLFFSTAQIFLITDLFFAFFKREFCLLNGTEFKIDGKEARMALE